jgi:hypothetical protein
MSSSTNGNGAPAGGFGSVLIFGSGGARQPAGV